MKNTLLVCIMLSITIFSRAQDSSPATDEKLNIDSFYMDKSNLMIYSGVQQHEQLKQAELVKIVKNWAGTRFVNLKEVLVSETDDQIVFNYVDQSLYFKTLGTKNIIDWYIRLVIQFKDGKIKCSYYDDGNVFRPGNQYAPTVRARSNHLDTSFKEKDGVLVAANSYKPGLLSLHSNIVSSYNSLSEYIDKKGKEKDW